MARILSGYKEKMAERGYLTVSDAAKKAGVTAGCLWNWISRDKLRDEKGRPTVKWMGVTWVRFAAVAKLTEFPRGI